MSGYSRPEENTLGAVIGKRGRPKPSATSPAARALRKASAGGASLGTGFLGVGAVVVAGVAGLVGLATFILSFPQHPQPLATVLAWTVYLMTLPAVGVAVAMAGERMADWLFVALLASLALVVALDLAAIWELRDVGANATASATAGFGLLLAVAVRRASEILIATGVLAAVFVGAILLTTPLTMESAPTQLVMLCSLILPPVFSTWLVAQFRGMVQLELDRALVQSTVSAPRLAVGMLASEELARLDLDAEELFESIADGRTDLPLDPKTASIAASLATELRLHLIKGRRETWLYHAITESEQLGKSVTLRDAASLAGLLDPRQRDGLLSAVWLLVSDKPQERRAIQLVLGPVGAASPAGSVEVPILLTSTGIARGRIDPAVWGSLAKVGPFSHTRENASLRVEIDCVVTSPADQYHAEQVAHREGQRS